MNKENNGIKYFICSLVGFIVIFCCAIFLMLSPFFMFIIPILLINQFGVTYDIAWSIGGLVGLVITIAIQAVPGAMGIESDGESDTRCHEECTNEV